MTLQKVSRLTFVSDMLWNISESRTARLQRGIPREGNPEYAIELAENIPRRREL